jgi:hypothetical protein
MASFWMLLVFVSIVVWFHTSEPLFVYRYQRNWSALWVPRDTSKEIVASSMPRL